MLSCGRNGRRGIVSRYVKGSYLVASPDGAKARGQRPEANVTSRSWRMESGRVDGGRHRGNQCGSMHGPKFGNGDGNLVTCNLVSSKLEKCKTQTCDSAEATWTTCRLPFVLEQCDSLTLARVLDT